MKSTEKIWHDENSEPPKNYIWAKNGKLFKYINGQWKEISKNNSGCDCPGAMFVHGKVDEIDESLTFTEDDGEPSSAAAKSHIENGGTLYIVISSPSPFGDIESTVPLAIIRTVNGITRLGFIMDGEFVSWQSPDFSVGIDFNNPDIANYEVTKCWSTQLDESTIGEAKTCKLFIDNYSYSRAILLKQDDGLFEYSIGNVTWSLMSRELALSQHPSWAIPETVKYVVVYWETVS